MDDLNYDYEWKEEIINGEIVAMAPPRVSHARAAKRLFINLEKYLSGKSCEAYYGDLEIDLDDDSHFIPDIAVVCDKSKFTDTVYNGAPALVVEVLSPSTAKNDRVTKYQAYEKYGVQEYWIVCVETQSIEQYVLKDGKYVLNGMYVDDGGDKIVFPRFFFCYIYEDLRIELAEIFD